VCGKIALGYQRSVGNLISEKAGSGNINGSANTDYQYNAMNQLVKKQTNSDTSTFAYDKRGNLSKETTKNKTLSYVFDGTNHL